LQPRAAPGSIVVAKAVPVHGASGGVRPAGRRNFVCWMTATWLMAWLGSAAHAAESASESSVMAAFLYKFPAYVEWPDPAHADASQPIEIGVLGDEDVRAAMEEIAAGRTPDERSIRVRRIDGLASVKGLHVLFIGDSALAAGKQYIAAAHAQSVLTVTEHGAAGQSSIIDFILVNGRLRFTISLPAAQRAKLQISSRLLAVAQGVRKEDGE
jgi:hypothetical protein